jgi:2-oxoglutarate ferredoxin oxidoreductase subunit beta
MIDYEVKQPVDMAWCPGCGNYNIRTALIAALQELDTDPLQLVFASGIGQAAKMPQYINANYFNGLHGRALPTAVAIKAANPGLTVIAEGGDGDMYGEGGNHFLHNIRRNPDLTHLVHDNRVYGLTKGQASPTSQLGFVTPVQTSGVINAPFNPLATALTLGATFVARAFSGDLLQTTAIIKAALQHRGYALVDMLQPCVSFNKINNFGWYKSHTYYLEESYDSGNFGQALTRSLDTDKLALGILYKGEERPTFEQQLQVYKDDPTPLTYRIRRIEEINQLLQI